MSVMLDAGAGSVLNDGEMEFLVISNIWPKQVNLSWQDVELMVHSNEMMEVVTHPGGWPLDRALQMVVTAF